MSIEQELKELSTAINNLSREFYQYSRRIEEIGQLKIDASYIKMSDDKDTLYTVKEVSKILKTNTTYVYLLIQLGLLPALKLGQYKITRNSLEGFLKRYEGKDLTSPENIKDLEFRK